MHDDAEIIEDDGTEDLVWQKKPSLYVQIWGADKLERIVNCERLCSDGVIDSKPAYKENNG